MADSFDFDEIMGKFFGSDGPKIPRNPPPTRPEKGMAWEAKLIDGVLYVPLSQVEELLAANSTLPKMQERIRSNVQAAADRKRMGI